MSVRIMSQVWDLDLPAGEKLVLLSLADQANDEGKQCWPSVETIMKRSGQGERTVRRALSELEAKGHLTRRHRDGASTQYHVHPCQSGTPAISAALPNRHETPAKLAPKPSRTTNTPQKATPSSERRAKPRLAWPVPEGVDPAHWSDFLANRKSKRLGFTETAHRGQLRDLAGLSDDEWPPGRLVEFAAERGWGAIHDPRKSENRHGHRSYHDRPSGPVEAGRRALAERGFLSDAALDHLPH